MSTSETDRSTTRTAASLIRNRVINDRGEEIGRIEEIVLDLDYGRISFAVVSFAELSSSGGEFFAIPWPALRPHPIDGQTFCLNVPDEVLKQSSGFAKVNWPNFSDRSWSSQVYNRFGYKTYFW